MTDYQEPKLTDIAYVHQLLEKHGFRFSKKLGQNFLINPSVCPRMAEACGAAKGVGVLEIGPGIGVLTKELALRGEKVVAIELDDRLPPVLAETLAGRDNVTVLAGDCMKMDLSAVLREHFPGMPVAVCANLPYYITSPIIMGLLESRLPVENITVMVQKEAAQRLCAQPGTREAGAVTLAVQYYAEAEQLFDVSRGSFLPSPNVDSTVIRLRVRSAPAVKVKDEKRMFSLIRAGFNQRRKTLPNSLSSLGENKEAVSCALASLGIPLTARAENLTLEQFGAIADALE